MSLFGVSTSGNSFAEAFDSGSNLDRNAPKFWEECKEEENEGEIEVDDEDSIGSLPRFILQRIVSFLDNKDDFFSIIYTSKILCKKTFNVLTGSHMPFATDLIISPTTQVPYVSNLNIKNPTGLTTNFLNRFYNLKRLSVVCGHIEVISRSIWHLSQLEYLKIEVLPQLSRMKTETFIRLLNSFKNLHTFIISGVILFQEKSPGEMIEENLETRSNLRELVLDFEKEVNNNYFLDFHEDFDLEHMKGSQLVTVITKGISELLFKRTYRFNNIFSKILSKCPHLESLTLKGQHNFSIYFEKVVEDFRQHNLKVLNIHNFTVSGLYLVLEVFPELETWTTEKCALKHFRPNDPGFIAHDKLHTINFSMNTAPVRDYSMMLTLFPKLKNLTMDRCTISDRAFKDKLPTDFSIEELSFSNNRIRFKGFKYILKRMRELKRLKLNNCTVSLDGDISNKSKGGYKDITHLELAGCTIGLRGFYEILGSFPSLVDLSVSRGKIVMSLEQKALEEIPGDGTKLRRLDFCGNKITKYGFLILLKKFVALEEFCVSSCDVKIGEEGLTLFDNEIEEVDKKSDDKEEHEENVKVKYLSLKKLNLSLNYVTTEGLVDVLETFPNLQHLDVIANQIAPGKMVFPQYPNLEIIQLFMNMELLEEVDILNMFRKNRQLKIVSFGDDKTGLKNLYWPIKDMLETKLK